MISRKSPSGALFPYYYKGGEIFGIHSGSFHSDEEGLIALLKAEEEFLIEQNRRMRFWVDFYEDNLTDKVLTEFVASIDRLCPHLVKLAIVGCSWRDRRRLNQFFKKSGVKLPIPVKYFDDPEVAKTWLVHES